MITSLQDLVNESEMVLNFTVNDALQVIENQGLSVFMAALLAQKPELKQETYKLPQTNTSKTKTQASKKQTYIRSIDSSNAVNPNSEIRNEVEINATFLSEKVKEEQEDKNNVTQTQVIAKQSKENQDKNYVSIAFNDMSNPIQPITQRLGVAIKKEIDFRTAKPTKRSSGGFYLKIGKLEVSHQNH